MPPGEQSRYWLCSLYGHPRPQDAPLEISTCEYLIWKGDETKLDLFVCYRVNRPFPSVRLKAYNPQPTKIPFADYLKDPFPPDSLCHGKLPTPRLLRLKPQKRIQKVIKPRTREARVKEPLVLTDKNIHYDCITGVTTLLGFTYGQWPPANASKNLE